MLKFLGKRRKRQLLRSLFSDPLPEGHPVDRDNFLCLVIVFLTARVSMLESHFTRGLRAFGRSRRKKDRLQGPIAAEMENLVWALQTDNHLVWV